MSLKRPESYREPEDKRCNNCRLRWGFGLGSHFCLKPLLDAGVIQENPNDVVNGKVDNPELERLNKILRGWFKSNPDISISFTDGVCDDHEE